jgi:hypothetical protein
VPPSRLADAVGPAWLRSTLGRQSMRTLVAVFVLLVCASAHAARLEYSSSRKWVEQRCTTNTVAQDERVFVGRIWSPQYAGVLGFHTGMTLREVIDQTPFKGETVQVLVLRPETRFSDHYMTIGPREKPNYEIKALDMIWLYDPGPIVNT